MKFPEWRKRLAGVLSGAERIALSAPIVLGLAFPSQPPTTAAPTPSAAIKVSAYADKFVLAPANDSASGTVRMQHSSHASHASHSSHASHASHSSHSSGGFAA
jgi:hypothetical protein